MGFAITARFAVGRAVADDPYLDGLSLGWGVLASRQPRREDRVPGGAFLRPAPERPHERHHGIAGVRRGRLRGGPPPGGRARLGVIRPRTAAPCRRRGAP